MDSIKRKKRKTRKCLDELRKRSRTKGQLQVNEQVGSSKQNNYITSQRLTLAFLPKVVHSETAKRALLQNNDPLNIPNECNKKNGVKKRCLENSNTFENEVAGDTSNSIEHISKQDSVKSREVQIAVFSDSDTDNIANNCNALSPAIFSSPVRISEQNNVNVNTSRDIVISSSQSSQSVWGDSVDYFYRKYLTDISSYIEETTPQLLNNEIVNEPLHRIRNMYIKACYDNKKSISMESSLSTDENNSVLSHNSSPSEAIVSNPREYIKIGNAWKHNRENPSDEENTDVVDSSPKRDATLFDGPLPDSNDASTLEADNASPDSMNLSTVEAVDASSPDAVVGSSPLPSLLCDPPSYNYYPHKLHYS